MKKNNSPRLGWIEKFTKAMDSQYRFPGTNFRFGLDPILGFVPFLGDAVSFGISTVLVMNLWRYGASGEVKAKMMVNILLDTLIGSIPVIGNIFDFFFKANQRNLNLYKRHFEKGELQGSGKGFLAIAIISVLIVMALAVWGLISLLKWIF